MFFPIFKGSTWSSKNYKVLLELVSINTSIEIQDYFLEVIRRNFLFLFKNSDCFRFLKTYYVSLWPTISMSTTKQQKYLNEFALFFKLFCILCSCCFAVRHIGFLLLFPTLFKPLSIQARSGSKTLIPRYCGGKIRFYAATTTLMSTKQPLF